MISNKICLYTTHYQNDQVIDSPCCVPIHVGCSLAKKSLYDVTDASGDNISDKNPTFCELTAHYWVWKNKLDSDYIGFMHHRRHLCFNEKNNDKINAWGLISYPEINSEYIEKVGLDETSIQSCIDGYDVIVADKWDVRITGNKNNYELYKNTDFLHISDYETAISILIEMHPEYESYITEYNNSSCGYYTNIFVMKKEVFTNYSEWIFPILFELESRLDIKDYSSVEKRVIGHIAERLVGIYLLKLESEANLKIKTLKRTIVETTEPSVKIEQSPKTEELKISAKFDRYSPGYTPIVVNFNEAYAHVAAACLQSIIANSSSDNNYDIFILGNGVSSRSISRYHDMTNNYPNINISYYDVSDNDILSKMKVNQYFSIETYFRLFIPKLFSDFKKVIYLDVDMIVNRDINKLIHVDLDDKCIAAVPCYIMRSFVQNKVVSNGETGNIIASDYLDKYIEINDHNNYVQAGLIVFNNVMLNEIDFVNKVMSELGETYWFLDQDIINKIVNGRVKFLPYNWNVMHGNNDIDGFLEILPDEEKELYLEARKEPYIIHYAGPEKPWNNKSVEFSDDYWKHLQNTIWFTDIVFDALHRHSLNNVVNSLSLSPNGFISKVKKFCRKSFDCTFPVGTSRRVIFARYYKKLRGI